MDNQYLNQFIDLGVEKTMRHHKFNDAEIDWYILLSRIQIRPVMRGRIRFRSKNGPDPQHCVTRR
jgi:hypothetical protein